MTPEAWRALRAPFPLDAVRWHVVEVQDAGRRMRLAPHLAVDAIRQRLDSALGPDGWSLTLAPWREAMVIATIDVGKVRRSAVASVVDLPGQVLAVEAADMSVQETATGVAWTVALAALGVTLPLYVKGDGFVDADPDRGEPLHPPEVVLVDPADRDAAAGAASTAGGVDATANRSPRVPDETSESDTEKPEGHRMIDRIVERLRAEGLGGQVARLVTRYGGYGHDADASRALYAELRALLRERAT